MPTRIRSAIYFYVVTFGAAAALAASGVLSETTTYMLTPATGVFAALLVTRQMLSRNAWAELGLHRLGFAHWPVAALVPTMIVGLGFAVTWATGEATLRLPESVLGMPLYDLVWAIPVAFVLNTVTWSLAEEVGWRGFLQPHLSGLGHARAALVTGLLWGLWHVPLITLTTLYHPGVDLPDFLPLFLASTTMAGLFFGWLRVETGSIWPASIAHTAHNIAVVLFMALTIEQSPDALTLSGEAGLVTIMGYGAIGWFLFNRDRPGQPSSMAHSRVG